MRLRSIWENTGARLLFGIGLGVISPLLGQPASDSPAMGIPVADFEIKAAFVLNFCRFVEWPLESIASEETPLVIATVNAEALRGILGELVSGVRVHGRPIEVVSARVPSDLDHADVVVFGDFELVKWAEALRRLQDRPILTIGPDIAFARDRGIIGFYLDSRRVRFAVNRQRAEAVGLKISARFLALAKIVGSESRLGGINDG